MLDLEEFRFSWPFLVRAIACFENRPEFKPIIINLFYNPSSPRALSNPSSLTDQERRFITHWPVQEEENTRC